MNHYDDLQRFKDKTRNQQYDFKDFSAQNTAPDQGNWTLINQLSPASDDSKLALGGHVSLPQPQPVDLTLFAHKESLPGMVSAEPIADATADVMPTSVAPILRDVAQQLASTHPSTTTTLTAAPAPVVAPVVKPASKPEFSAPAQPVPVQTTATPATEPASYARLFAPKPADVKPPTEKNQSLHTLLERIASCR